MPLLNAVPLVAMLLSLTLFSSAVATATETEEVSSRVERAREDRAGASAGLAAPTRGLLLVLPGDEPQVGQLMLLSLSIATEPLGSLAQPELVLASPALDAERSAGERIAEAARTYVGGRYAWAGDSPEIGFDCSGLAWFVYRELGLDIPKQDLQGQLDAGPRIDLAGLQPGDLVFFENTYQPGLSHVGIYVGEDEFVHAEWEETGVRTSKLQGSQWLAKFVGGSRPW